MGSGCLVDTSSRVLGGEDWALTVGGGRVRGTRRYSRNSVWGDGLEEVEKLQRGRDGRDSPLGTIDSSVDQQHRTTFCALKDARSRNKQASLMGGGFWWMRLRECLGGRTGPLGLEVAGSAVREDTVATVFGGKGGRR